MGSVFDNEQKLDASELIFFQRQLEQVKTRTYDKKYPMLKARNLISPDFSTNAGAKSITYRSYSQFGVAKVIANYAKDLPRAGVKGEEFTSPVKELGASYGYSWKDVQSAAMANVNLVDREAMAAKRAIMQKENSIAWLGDTEHNIPGFLTNANLPTAAAAADGTGASSLWSTKTVDQIVRDIDDMIHGVSQNTNGVEQPNTVLIAHNRWPSMTKRLSGGNDKTVLQFLKETFPEITVWDWLVELNTAGTGSTAMALAYNRDPEYVEMQVPQDFLQLPVQEEGLEYQVPCVASTGGTILYYPLSANSIYGI